MSLRAGRVLLATAAIGLWAGVFGEQALALELPTPPAAPDLPAVEAVEVPEVPAPAVVAPQQLQEAVAEVERTAQEAAPPAVAEVAVAAPAQTEQPVAPAAVVTRVSAPARHDPRPVRPARKAAPKQAAARTVSPSARAPERIESPPFLPEAAGAAGVARPPRTNLPAAAGDTLLQDAAAGGPGTLSAAVSTPLGIPPDALLWLVAASILLRRTLVTSFLERPG